MTRRPPSFSGGRSVRPGWPKDCTWMRQKSINARKSTIGPRTSGGFRRLDSSLPSEGRRQSPFCKQAAPCSTGQKAAKASMLASEPQWAPSGPEVSARREIDKERAKHGGATHDRLRLTAARNRRRRLKVLSFAPSSVTRRRGVDVGQSLLIATCALTMTSSSSRRVVRKSMTLLLAA